MRWHMGLGCDGVTTWDSPVALLEGRRRPLAPAPDRLGINGSAFIAASRRSGEPWPGHHELAALVR